MRNQWTLGKMLEWATGYLQKSGSHSPRLDAQLLLGNVVGLDKVQLYVQFERPMVPGELATFKDLIKRRSTGEPVAYILGRREFYGRSFQVDSRVLIPRPETEHLVDAVLTWLKSEDMEAPRIVDVGTGSGCVAITLALEHEGAILVGIDKSPDALSVASQNATLLDVRERVKLTRGDVLSPLSKPGSLDVVVSNPPYLDDHLMSTMERDVRDFEPHLALHGGADGLDIHRQLVIQAASLLRPGGLLAVELASTEQAEVLKGIWNETEAFSAPILGVDYAQRGRVLQASRR